MDDGTRVLVEELLWLALRAVARWAEVSYEYTAQGIRYVLAELLIARSRSRDVLLGSPAPIIVDEAPRKAMALNCVG